MQIIERKIKGAKAKEKATSAKMKGAVEEDKEEAVGKTADGKVVYEGSKNGHYYMNDKGEKTYVKDFVGAKIVGQTESGKTIYEGPRGGHFYYNDNGNKTYVKK